MFFCFLMNIGSRSALDPYGMSCYRVDLDVHSPEILDREPKKGCGSLAVTLTELYLRVVFIFRLLFYVALYFHSLKKKLCFLLQVQTVWNCSSLHK